MMVSENLAKLKELTKSINKSSKDTETFFDLAIDLFCIADEKKFVKVNHAWESWTGWSQEEIEGKKWRDFCREDELAAIDKMVNIQMRASNVIDFISHIRKKDGKYLKVEWRSTMWKGGLTYSVGRPFLDE